MNLWIITITGILNIFYVPKSIAQLSESEQQYWACYGSHNGKIFMDASCPDVSQVIAVKGVYAGSKLDTSPCPEETVDPFIAALEQLCCSPHDDDCTSEYNNKDHYHTACTGRNVCPQLQASNQVTDPGCEGSYLTISNYMYMDYYCIAGTKIGKFDSADLSTDRYTMYYLQSSNYPTSAITAGSSYTCSVETDCGETIFVALIDIRLAESGGTCGQTLTITDGSASRVISCADNNDYVIQGEFYYSQGNYLLLELTSELSTDDGYIWIGIQATGGSLTVKCPSQSQTCSETTIKTTTITTSTPVPPTTQDQIVNGSLPSQTNQPQSTISSQTTTNGLDGGTIALIVILLLVAVAIVITILLCCIYKKKKKKKEETAESGTKKFLVGADPSVSNTSKSTDLPPLITKSNLTVSDLKMDTSTSPSKSLEDTINHQSWEDNKNSSPLITSTNRLRPLQMSLPPMSTGLAGQMSTSYKDKLSEPHIGTSKRETTPFGKSNTGDLTGLGLNLSKSNPLSTLPFGIQKEPIEANGSSPWDSDDPAGIESELKNKLSTTQIGMFPPAESFQKPTNKLRFEDETVTPFSGKSPNLNTSLNQPQSRFQKTVTDSDEEFFTTPASSRKEDLFDMDTNVWSSFVKDGKGNDTGNSINDFKQNTLDVDSSCNFKDGLSLNSDERQYPMDNTLGKTQDSGMFLESTEPKPKKKKKKRRRKIEQNNEEEDESHRVSEIDATHTERKHRKKKKKEHTVSFEETSEKEPNINFNAREAMHGSEGDEELRDYGSGVILVTEVNQTEKKKKKKKKHKSRESTDFEDTEQKIKHKKHHQRDKADKLSDTKAPFKDRNEEYRGIDSSDPRFNYADIFV